MIHGQYPEDFTTSKVSVGTSRRYKKMLNSPKGMPWALSNIDMPTVDELEDINKRGLDALLKQICLGQGVYRGHDAETFFNNDIRDLSYLDEPQRTIKWDTMKRKINQLMKTGLFPNKAEAQAFIIMRLKDKHV